jgi:hypothetical protein
MLIRDTGYRKVKLHLDFRPLAEFIPSSAEGLGVTYLYRPTYPSEPRERGGHFSCFVVLVATGMGDSVGALAA